MPPESLDEIKAEGPLQRYDGGVDVCLGPTGVTRLRQTPPMRLFRPYPETGEPQTYVIGNIAGGVTGGDVLSTRIEADGTELLAVTQAAEKVYRAHGGAARMSLELTAGRGGSLEWLSSGTILFDGADLDRTTTLSVEGDAKLCFVEIVMFGRAARGERFETGRLRDRIRLVRDGGLVWMDDLALGPNPLEQLQATAGFDGATATGTVLMTGIDAVDLRDRVRALETGGADIRDGDVRSGIVALDETSVLFRALGPRADGVRRSVEAACMLLRSHGMGRPEKMPTIWSV